MEDISPLRGLTLGEGTVYPFEQVYRALEKLLPLKTKHDLWGVNSVTYDPRSRNAFDDPRTTRAKRDDADNLGEGWRRNCLRWPGCSPRGVARINGHNPTFNLLSPD